jgi:hypothetical protein
MSTPCQPTNTSQGHVPQPPYRPHFPIPRILNRGSAVYGAAEWGRAGRRRVSQQQASAQLQRQVSTLRPARRRSKTTGRPLSSVRDLLQNEQPGGCFMQTYGFHRDTTRTDIVTDRQVLLLSGGDSISPLFINGSFVCIGQLTSPTTLLSKEESTC